MNGIRSSKTVNGVKHNYITQDGKVIREEYGTTVLEFVYDTNGAPYALRYSSDSGKNWMTYYYVLNLQGDVVKLLYADGSIRAEYTYNAWGEILSATNPSASTVNIQDINPLRYRGYYYDTETGFYYLESRYYDPIVKRFINADGYASTGQGIIGTNMFAYCENNPTNKIDCSGTAGEMVSEWGFSAWWLTLIDGPLPIGDFIYGAGLVILGVVEVGLLNEATDGAEKTPEIKIDPTSPREPDEEPSEPEPPSTPDVKYPGDDPTKAPEGTEWRGKGKQGSKDGNYYNPKTKESFHPDLDHPAPVKPHWDYRDSWGKWWCIFGDNTMDAK